MSFAVGHLLGADADERPLADAGRSRSQPPRQAGLVGRVGVARCSIAAAASSRRHRRRLTTRRPVARCSHLVRFSAPGSGRWPTTCGARTRHRKGNGEGCSAEAFFELTN